ncbi:hypothetical protein [Microbacterium sp. T2.11-28]|uniref:hypothetical protein n=1 Tax=Microbacterium sp. T2.11-28 TaxID=3041169 RepID=UPI002477C3A9|nr:hypothetical protein [Microbacterium sp. T2.11-28]CAI9388329.1 hypothetical protein MICABA_03024 [Microbacterium sp. T2.11-28]
MTRDVPDDIVDAEPAGGWSSTGPVDAESGADALAAVQEEAPDEETSTTPAAPAPDGDLSDGDSRASDPYVESAEIQQGLDPDLLTDEQADR